MKSNFTEKIKQAYQLYQDCSVCPRRCGVNRLNNEIGFCGIGKDVVISSTGSHYGEERPLVGRHGSGTIFLSGCNLKCAFCQNSEISHSLMGRAVTVKELVDIMMTLAHQGCHNINFVTPTQVTPHLMDAIVRARAEELKVPIVYNCGGYESMETLKLLEGLIDIYMPDTKFSTPEWGEKLCQAENYYAILQEALREMHRQVGDLAIKDGLATRGLLIRHLVMPGKVAGSEKLIDFIRDKISPNSYINVMGQYHPQFKASEHPEINRPVTSDEFRAVHDYAREQGLRLDK